MNRLSVPFFERSADEVAQDLIGATFVRTLPNRRKLLAKIVETEAYIGAHDLACHAAKGRTARTEILFGPAARTYIYLIYGMYELFNVVCGVKGDAQAVLIRAAEAINFSADLAGPGKFGRGLHLTRDLNGVSVLRGPIQILPATDSKRVLRSSPRIGVDYAGTWARRHLRFFDSQSKSVSAHRKGRALKISRNL